MASTLKERYVAKQVQHAVERKYQVDMKDLRENGAIKLMVKSLDTKEKLIYEAFDQKSTAVAIDVIKKLKAIDFGLLKTLASARDLAVQDVMKVMGGSGGGTAGLAKKIVSMFKSEPNNPLSDTLAFADALHNFFGQLTPFLDAMATGKEGVDQMSVQELVTGTTPNETDDLSAGGLDVEAKKKLGDLQNLILKGLRPEGALAKVAEGWKEKYLKNNLKGLAQDIIKSTVGEIKLVAGSVKTGLANTTVAGQAAVNAAQVATEKPAETSGPDVATGNTPTTTSKHTKITKPGNAGAGVKGGQGSEISKISKATGVSEDDVTKLINHFRDLGWFKADQK